MTTAASARAPQLALDRYAMTTSTPPTNPRRPLLKELAAAAGTWGFWGVTLRSCVAPVGVFALGWSAMSVVVYYTVEIWLYLALRLSFEVALDPKVRGPGPFRPWSVIKQGLSIALVGLPVSAVVIGAVAAPFLAFLFGRDQSRKDLAVLSSSTDFLLAVGVLAVLLLAEILAFALRFPTRSAEQEAIDEYRGASTAMRLVCLATVGALALLVPYHTAGRMLVVAVSLMSVWVEGVPRHAAGTFGYRPSLPGQTAP